MYISYNLFADVNAGIYPHAAPQYHIRQKAERFIVVLSVDKFTGIGQILYLTQCL